VLRVHQPERHGDTINRHTTLTAEKTGKISIGAELGPIGTFTCARLRRCTTAKGWSATSR